MGDTASMYSSFGASGPSVRANIPTPSKVPGSVPGKVPATSGGSTDAQAKDIMLVSMATSAISSVSSAIQNAQAIKAQGFYASSIANSNAAMAKLKATQALQAGDVAASRKDMVTRGQVGTARAMASGSGVDVNVGSPAAVQSEIRTAGASDVLTIKNNAAREAWGYQTQAIQDTFEGQFSNLTAKSKAQQSLVTGGLQAISGPMALWAKEERIRYSSRGNSGEPYPSRGGGGGGGGSEEANFWGKL